MVDSREIISYKFIEISSFYKVNRLWVLNNPHRFCFYYNIAGFLVNLPVLCQNGILWIDFSEEYGYFNINSLIFCTEEKFEDSKLRKTIWGETKVYQKLTLDWRIFSWFLSNRLLSDNLMKDISWSPGDNTESIQNRKLMSQIISCIDVQINISSLDMHRKYAKLEWQKFLTVSLSTI